MGTGSTETDTTRAHAAPVEAARVAIWRLFEEGYVDEDMATASLLAVDLGTRRTQRRPDSPLEDSSGEARGRRSAA